jgi:hypothetical protein
MKFCLLQKMPDILAFGVSGTGMKKLTMAELVRYRTQATQSGIFFFFCPVPVSGDECRNADAGVRFLDVDAKHRKTEG